MPMQVLAKTRAKFEVRYSKSKEKNFINIGKSSGGARLSTLLIMKCAREKRDSRRPL